jgi:hypothetical protein
MNLEIAQSVLLLSKILIMLLFFLVILNMFIMMNVVEGILSLRVKLKNVLSVEMNSLWMILKMVLKKILKMKNQLLCRWIDAIFLN